MNDDFAAYLARLRIFFAPTRTWVGECEQEATASLSLPDKDDPRWIKGTPDVLDADVLTLCHFFPSGRLGVCVEQKQSDSSIRYPNHPPFDGCVAWMPLEPLRLLAQPIQTRAAEPV